MSILYFFAWFGFAVVGFILFLAVARVVFFGSIGLLEIIWGATPPVLKVSLISAIIYFGLIVFFIYI